MDNFLIAFLFGPIAGIITGILSYLITTMTFDPYALPNIPTGNFSLSVWDLQQVL